MKDWRYASKDTIRKNIQDMALDAIAEVLWGEICDETKKLHMIEGIMTLAAEIDEDIMAKPDTEVKYDAQA